MIYDAVKELRARRLEREREKAREEGRAEGRRQERADLRRQGIEIPPDEQSGPDRGGLPNG